MTPRNTSTGAVLEAMILPALDRGGYAWRVQAETGTRPGGRRHQVDAVATKDGQDILASLKWQQTSGTAAPEAGVGIGGAIVILGAAFIANSLVSRSTVSDVPPAPRRDDLT